MQTETKTEQSNSLIQSLKLQLLYKKKDRVNQIASYKLTNSQRAHLGGQIMVLEEIFNLVMYLEKKHNEQQN